MFKSIVNNLLTIKGNTMDEPDKEKEPKYEYEPKKVGRPLKFETPDDLIEAITEYFQTTNFKHYTVTGLALVIGSKQLLADYGERDGYKEIVAQAKLTIEHSYEISLRTDAKPVGAIFGLKNFGWSDRVDIDHGGKVEIITIIDDIPDTDDE